MKKYRIVIAAALVLLTAGCQSGDKKQEEVNVPSVEQVVREKTSDFLGASDNDIVESKGEGEAVTYTQNGTQVISQRKYQEKLFGLDADVEYFYGDEGSISEIVAVFNGVERDAIVSGMAEELGEPQEKQEESAETQFRYFWEKDGKIYTLLDPQNAAPAVIIQEKKS